MTIQVTKEKNRISFQDKKPISILIEKDEQEKKFEEMVKLWIDNEITFSQLMDDYPSYDASMLERIIKKINKIVQNHI